MGDIKRPYSVFAKEMEIQDHGLKKTYGVQCDDGQSKGGCLWVADVSTNPLVAERLAEQCNRCEVSREHFLEIVEDFLANGKI